MWLAALAHGFRVCAGGVDLKVNTQCIRKLIFEILLILYTADEWLFMQTPFAFCVFF